MPHPVVVVGAGLAGLTCARSLAARGIDHLVLEASDGPGGRLRTDVVEGFRLDRGFQVYFEAYPHAAAVLDHARLDFRAFEAGARIRWDGAWRTVSQDHPMRTVRDGLLPLGDQWRTLAWSREVDAMAPEDAWAGDDQPASALLRQKGFTDRFFARFARPFFGGIFLDRSLEVSAQAFTYVWKMLRMGRTVVPAAGMAAIPAQLAEGIDLRAVRWRTPAVEVVRDGAGAATGVRTAAGEVIGASQVVLAADPATTRRLAGLPADDPAKASVCVYFDAPAAPGGGAPTLLLRGDGAGIVNEVVPVSSVAPETAPRGRALVSATVLGEPGRTDRDLALDVRYELRAWFPELDVASWRPLAVYRIPDAQAAQRPGFRDRAPAWDAGGPGVVLAGETTTYSSIDGAILSGVQAAAAVAERA